MEGVEEAETEIMIEETVMTGTTADHALDLHVSP